jgi:hypothetical protein
MVSNHDIARCHCIKPFKLVHGWQTVIMIYRVSLRPTPATRRHIFSRRHFISYQKGHRDWHMSPQIYKQLNYTRDFMRLPRYIPSHGVPRVSDWWQSDARFSSLPVCTRETPFPVHYSKKTIFLPLIRGVNLNIENTRGNIIRKPKKIGGFRKWIIWLIAWSIFFFCFSVCKCFPQLFALFQI